MNRSNRISHRWDITPAEAIALQRELASRVVCEGMPAVVRHVAGVDLAFDKSESAGYCAIVTFSFPDMRVVEERFCRDRVAFPYVPGLLSFREGPLVLKTFLLCGITPDLVLFDGQGIAHPRRFGIASHMGLLLGIPSIGCAKSRLYGVCDEPGREKGLYSILRDPEGHAIGAAVRTRANTKPVFVSPGHCVGLDEAVDLVLRCCGRYRIPEPTRIAHNRVGEYKRSM